MVIYVLKLDSRKSASKQEKRSSGEHKKILLLWSQIARKGYRKVCSSLVFVQYFCYSGDRMQTNQHSQMRLTLKCANKLAGATPLVPGLDLAVIWSPSRHDN